jgi:hypothetical protein
MRDMDGITSHVLKMIVRSNLKRNLTTTFVVIAMRNLNLKQGKQFSIFQIHCDIYSSTCIFSNKPNLRIHRYKIKLEISDSTAAATHVLFEKEAQMIIGDSAGFIIASVNHDDNELPKQIQERCGQTLISQLKLSEYNFTSLRPDYTVSRQFLPDVKSMTKMDNGRVKEVT